MLSFSHTQLSPHPSSSHILDGGCRRFLARRQPHPLSAAGRLTDTQPPPPFRPTDVQNRCVHDLALAYRTPACYYRRKCSQTAVGLASSLQTIVQAAVSHDNVVGSSGCWVIQRNDTDACDCSAVTSIRQQRSHGPVEIAGTFAAPCRSLSWTLTFTAASFGPALEFSLALDAVPADGHNRLILSFQRDASERFFGFGQQYTHLDAAGDSVPIFGREQGIIAVCNQSRPR